MTRQLLDLTSIPRQKHAGSIRFAAVKPRSHAKKIRSTSAEHYTDLGAALGNQRKIGSTTISIAAHSTMQHAGREQNPYLNPYHKRIETPKSESRPKYQPFHKIDSSDTSLDITGADGGEGHTIVYTA